MYNRAFCFRFSVKSSDHLTWILTPCIWQISNCFILAHISTATQNQVRISCCVNSMLESPKAPPSLFRKVKFPKMRSGYGFCDFVYAQSKGFNLIQLSTCDVFKTFTKRKTNKYILNVYTSMYIYIHTYIHTYIRMMHITIHEASPAGLLYFECA